MNTNSNLLELKNLSKYFKSKNNIIGKGRVLKAIDNISLTIKKGETVGIVGESGCGKSTLGRVILRLIEPTYGNIIYDKINLLELDKAEMREMRKRMQIIFQNPYSSLNSRMTIQDIVKAPLDVFKIGTRNERIDEVIKSLECVGLGHQHLHRYPHEFSGGQRQRIVIARALILNPEFIVCDEPVSALDVSVRSQVLNLMVSLQKEFNLTYLFISHDLSVVKHLCEKVAVMYLGEIVEIGSRDRIYNTPLHPYTEALLSAIPIPDIDIMTERIILKGDVPSPYNKPKGCPFVTRCNKALPICSEMKPPVEEITKDHFVACHLYV